MTASPISHSDIPSTSPVEAVLPPLWGRIETLWLLMAPLCALLYALCLPLAPNDLWYHVRAGELISRGVIPTQNAMSSGIPLNAPYYYQSWLAELGLFWTLKWGGLSALALLRSFFVAGAFGLVTAASFRFLLRLSTPPPRIWAARLTALSAVVGLLMASNNLDLRPQLFSFFGFAVWVFAVLEFRASTHFCRARWGAILVILTLFWANIHGAFIISVLGLLALALGDFLGRREDLGSSPAVAFAASVAALVNPRGVALYGYVAGLSRDEVSQKFVQEWKSPGFDEWHSLLFWMSAAGIFLFVVIAQHHRNRRSKESIPQKMKVATRHSDHRALLGAAALFFVMAARDQRSIVWFALWFVPLFGALAGHFRSERAPASAPPAPAPPVPRAAQIINAVLLVFLLMGPLALFPRFKANWPWPQEFHKRFAPTPSSFASDASLLLENTTPVAAAQFLMQHPPRGRLWTDMVCGSYLTYAGRGQIRPFCDPRIEMFPVAFWEDYLRLSSGPADAVAQLQNRGFSDVLLDKENMPALVRRFRQDSGWRIVAQNGSTLLFRRTQPKIS